jgi:hypothetical protein
VEYISLIGVLARKLYTLVLLRLYPPRSGAKPSPISSFVGLKEFIVPIAIVEDLSIGLKQPIAIGSPNRLIVIVELLLEVVSILVSDVLEL